MGQDHIYDFLKKKREAYDDSFFTINGIIRGMRGRYKGASLVKGNVRDQTIKLWLGGFLERKVGNGYINPSASFRIKKKYVKRRKSKRKS